MRFLGRSEKVSLTFAVPGEETLVPAPAAAPALPQAASVYAVLLLNILDKHFHE